MWRTFARIGPSSGRRPFGDAKRTRPESLAADPQSYGPHVFTVAAHTAQSEGRAVGYGAARVWARATPLLESESQKGYRAGCQAGLTPEHE